MSTSLERTLSIALLTPMDDPRNPACRWGLPLMLWGPPAVAKSSRVVQAANMAGLLAKTVYPATHQPEDASGIPIPDGKGGMRMECLLPGIVELNTAGKGVLFIDELSCARPAVQGAFLNIIYERTWLKPGVRILAAGNPSDSAAGGWTLAAPMANRLAHLDVPPPSVEEWTAWLLQGQNQTIEKIEQGEQRIKDAWPKVFPKWKSLVAGFLRSRTGSGQQAPTLHALPPVGHKHRGRAWPSPRTWEFAIRAAASVEALGSPYEKQLPDIVSGCIGEGQALEWLTWVKKADLPDPEDVLKNGWKPNKNRLDVCLAVCSSVVAYTLERTDPKERHDFAVLCWKFLNTIFEENLPDVAASATQGLLQAGYGHKHSPEMYEACKPVITRLGTTGIARYMTT